MNAVAAIFGRFPRNSMNMSGLQRTVTARHHI
jgi:hypothetical protein